MDTMIKETRFIKRKYGQDAYIHHIREFGYGGEESARRFATVEQMCNRNFLIVPFGTKVLYVKIEKNVSVA